MVNKNLVGRCGLYCGFCLIYRAGKDSEKLRRAVLGGASVSLRIFGVRVVRRCLLTVGKMLGGGRTAR